MKTDYLTVKPQIRNGVAVLVLDNPPVNQMSDDFMAEVEAAVGEAQADPEVRVIVLGGAVRNFLAGADVTQLLAITEKAVMIRHLEGVHRFFNSIEGGPKPVIAAINGTCLGGGLELAMSCHYRLAAPGINLGLPEVNMGVIPGAGGTQRLPRLIGLPTALDLMLGGKVIKSEKAFSLGLVDELVPAEGLMEAALAAAEKILKGRLSWKTRLTNRRIDRLPSAREKQDIIAAAAEGLAKRSKGYIAPAKLLEAVDKGLSTENQQADLMREADLFSDCVVSDVCKNLITLFLAERAAGKLPRVKGLKPDKPGKVAMLGGGVMGSGIVHLLLNAGLDTVLWDINDQALEKARAAVAKTYAFQIKKGKLKPDQLARLMDEKLTLTTDLADLGDVDLVIEAVLEDMAVKQGIWKKLDSICRPEAIFGTNTSALPITEMASVLANSSRMLGLHFFNPAERMPLLEVICARQTGDQTLANGVAFARTLRKVPVVVNDGPGFYVTRQLISLPSAAMYLLADGVDMRAVDRAVTNFGLPMGPFTLEDLTGLDIGFHVLGTFAREMGERYRLHPLHRAIHALGDYGRKTGRGFYDYADKHPVPNRRVLEVVETYRREQGVAAREAGPQEIIDCLMACAVNEAALMIQEGICDRPADMDLAMVRGTGFPPYRGGILRYADKWGAANVYESLLTLHDKYGPRFEPAALIKRLAEEGGAFHQM